MRILLLGATGSAGGSVLRVCLASPRVVRVHALARRSLAVEDAKLRAFVHNDYLDYRAVPEAFPTFVRTPGPPDCPPSNVQIFVQ